MSWGRSRSTVSLRSVPSPKLPTPTGETRGCPGSPRCRRGVRYLTRGSRLGVHSSGIRGHRLYHHYSDSGTRPRGTGSTGRLVELRAIRYTRFGRRRSFGRHEEERGRQGEVTHHTPCATRLENVEYDEFEPGGRFDIRGSPSLGYNRKRTRGPVKVRGRRTHTPATP